MSRSRAAARLGAVVGPLAVLGAIAASGSNGAGAAPLEEPGVAAMHAIGEHCVWVPDIVLAHSLLFDGDSGEVLAAIDGGTTLSPKPPLLSRERGEIYSVEIDYSRGRRGRRADYVTIYDTDSLDVAGEVVLPTHTSESAASLGYVALLDGSHFLATFNQFPTTSVSIVDLDARAFVDEIVVAGCAGIYPTGPRGFGMLCGDGTLLAVELDADGRKLQSVPTERIFDAVDDPLMMAGGRIGSRWIFVSFRGVAHEVDFSASPPVATSWPLVSDVERDEGWRPGGRQLLAVHGASGRLFVIFHRGGPGSHKEPGREVWVYDVATHRRTARFEMPNFTAAFLGDLLRVPTDGVAGWLLAGLLPDEGADTIAVSQDDAPLLFARNSRVGAVAVLDARTGEHLRNLSEVGLAGMRLEVP